MKILVAEDDPVSRLMLSAALARWGHAVAVATDGLEAMRLLDEDPGIGLLLLDWMMPGLDGLEVCRRVRALGRGPCYILVVTARTATEDVVQALEAGADDHVAKPFDHAELRSRIAVGVRTLALESALREKVDRLEAALARVKRLEGLLPICMHCKRIRDRQQRWQQLEEYISEHSGAEFSHGLCERCFDEHYPDPAGACSGRSPSSEAADPEQAMERDGG